MIGELAHFSLILGFLFAILLSTLPLLGRQQNHLGMMSLFRPLAFALMAFVGLAFVLLMVAFVQDDFSIAYIANNAHTDLPLMFKISATWGAHEGSLLLWAWLLTIWIWVASRFSSVLAPELAATAFAVMGMIAIGLISFILFTSNPFERLLDIPAQGKSLNPLLQDIGLVMHPPILYLGYVGFVVPFALAIASLYDGRFPATTAVWMRPWALLAWAFLTLGIALGSWWAYYELGWGGWWFWDPVENASLLPWLAATALIHSLRVSQQSGQFASWTLLLAILAFSLSLLGTFLVRSGVLTSVHAFTSDPSRGVFILLFLIVVVGASLALYALRAQGLASRGRWSLSSKIFALLLNNMILMVMLATVLLGTLYPLLLDALGLGKLSVGAPYFNSVMMPLTFMLALLMGFAFVLQWQKTALYAIWQQSRWQLLLSLLAATLVALWLSHEDLRLFLGIALSIWVALSVLIWVWSMRGRPNTAVIAPALGHLGFAMLLLGMVVTALLSQEKDVRLVVGGSYTLADYRFEFKQVTEDQVENYQRHRAEILLWHRDQQMATLYPEKRFYQQTTMPMTEAAIDVGIWRDVFVALGEPLGSDAWSVRLQIKPFIRWIWFGALLMALGAMLSAWQLYHQRYAALDKP